MTRHRLVVECESDASPEAIRAAVAGLVTPHLAACTVRVQAEQLNLLDVIDVTLVTANDEGPSHRGDPATSRIAARLNAPRSGTQRARVLLALAERAQTDYELERRLGLKHSSVGTRRGELVEGGFVEITDETRLTDTGSPAAVWRVTAKGAQAAVCVRHEQGATR